MVTLKHLPQRSLLLIIALSAAPACMAAGNASATIAVSATVLPTCAIATTPVAFGVYNPASAGASTASGSVTLVCTSGSTPTVTLNDGLYANGGQRRMKASLSANYLSYDLYQPDSVAASGGTGCATHATRWRSGGGQILTVGSILSITAVSFTVCGVASPGQDVPADVLYSDTVTATVTF